MKIRLLMLVCALVGLLAVQVVSCPAQINASGGGERVTLDFKEIELQDLIQTIGELTGKNFIYDETVRGKVTITSPRPISREEAYQVFLSVLNVKGYTIIPSGGINKIVAIASAKESNLPLAASGSGLSHGEQYVTQLMPLQFVNATEIATTVLAPLMPRTSNIVAYAPSNTLIMTDSAANIGRLIQILQQLDVPSTSEVIEVISLEHVNAEEIAKVVSQLLSQSTTGRASRRAPTQVATAGERETGRIIPFRPTNVLVVMASAEEIETVRAMVARLDQKPSQLRSGIQVYYLENADAESLARTLNEILTGIKSRSGMPRAGSGQQPQQQILEAVTITADKPTNSLVINSTPEDYDTIRDIIKQLDIRRRQVYVEALILELSMDATRKLGASLQGAVATSSDGAIIARTGPNTDNAARFNPANPLASVIDGILVGGVFNPISIVRPDGKTVTVPALSALIDLSRQDGDINILSAPRLLTSDNEEAQIVVGQNVPIITSRLTGASGDQLAQSVAVERKDVALTLRFTPQITEGNLVRLNIYQEITALAQRQVGEVNQVGPTFTTRQLRNTVLAENGRTVALGGLISSTFDENVTKVPLLGDVPVFGWLFKSKTSREEKRNLLIFITPHIVKNAHDLGRVTDMARESMDRFQETDMRSHEAKQSWARERIQMERSEPPEARESE